jgi:hypothetical protein
MMDFGMKEYGKSFSILKEKNQTFLKTFVLDIGFLVVALIFSYLVKQFVPTNLNISQSWIWIYMISSTTIYFLALILIYSAFKISVINLILENKELFRNFYKFFKLNIIISLLGFIVWMTFNAIINSVREEYFLIGSIVLRFCFFLFGFILLQKIHRNFGDGLKNQFNLSVVQTTIKTNKEVYFGVCIFILFGIFMVFLGGSVLSFANDPYSYIVVQERLKTIIGISLTIIFYILFTTTRYLLIKKGSNEEKK